MHCSDSHGQKLYFGDASKTIDVSTCYLPEPDNSQDFSASPLVGHWIGGFSSTLAKDNSPKVHLDRTFTVDIRHHMADGSILGRTENELREVLPLGGTAAEFSHIMLRLSSLDDEPPVILEGELRHHMRMPLLTGTVKPSEDSEEPVYFCLRRRPPVTELFPHPKSAGDPVITARHRWNKAIEAVIRRRRFDAEYIHQRRLRRQFLVSFAQHQEELDPFWIPDTDKWALMQGLTGPEDAQFWSMCASFKFAREIP